MVLISALNTFCVPVHLETNSRRHFTKLYHGSPSSEQQDAINTLCREIKFKYLERNKSAAWREERADQVSGPQTAIKRADVEQIVRRASCSTNVISLSLVIISRSVGREIQIHLPEGRERKKEFLDVIQEVYPLHTRRTYPRQFAHEEFGGSTEALRQEVRSPSVRLFGSGGKSSVLSEDVFAFFPRSFSVDVMVFKTSVPCFHRWLFIVFVLDGCDDASYVELATTPESFITLSP